MKCRFDRRSEGDGRRDLVWAGVWLGRMMLDFGYWILGDTQVGLLVRGSEKRSKSVSTFGIERSGQRQRLDTQYNPLSNIQNPTSNRFPKRIAPTIQINFP